MELHVDCKYCRNSLNILCTQAEINQLNNNTTPVWTYRYIIVEDDDELARLTYKIHGHVAHVLKVDLTVLT